MVAVAHYIRWYTSFEVKLQPRSNETIFCSGNGFVHMSVNLIMLDYEMITSFLLMRIKSRDILCFVDGILKILFNIKNQS